MLVVVFKTKMALLVSAEIFSIGAFEKNDRIVPAALAL
jgi:hypothetical protein